jgi:hypothetical protein
MRHPQGAANTVVVPGLAKAPYLADPLAGQGAGTGLLCPEHQGLGILGEVLALSLDARPRSGPCGRRLTLFAWPVVLFRSPRSLLVAETSLFSHQGTGMGQWRRLLARLGLELAGATARLGMAGKAWGRRVVAEQGSACP